MLNQLLICVKVVEKKDVFCKVVKNNLAKIAVKDTQYEGLTDNFKGPTALLYSNDIIATSKLLVSFAKEHESLKIIAGAIKSQLIDSKEVSNLAKLGSVDNLKSKFAAINANACFKINTNFILCSCRVVKINGCTYKR